MPRKEPLEETLARLYAGMSEEEILVAESERLANAANGINIKGENNMGMLGKNHSEEAKKAISAKLAGIARPAELVKRTAEKQRGKVITDEHKKNMKIGTDNRYIKRCQSIGIEHPTMDGTMKVCFYCGKEKPVTEFFKLNSKYKKPRWGVRDDCKQCFKDAQAGNKRKAMAKDVKLDKHEKILSYKGQNVPQDDAPQSPAPEPAVKDDFLTQVTQLVPVNKGVPTKRNLTPLTPDDIPF